MRSFTLCILLCVFLLTSCHRDKPLRGINEGPTLFSLVDSTTSHVNFINAIDDTASMTYYTSSYIYNGGGVAVADLNNDGLQDLIFTGNQVKGKIYLNKGNFKFEDITSSSGFDTKNGWTTGVSVADINGDGWPDIYVCKAASTNVADRTNLLFINNHNLTFTEEAAKYGLNDTVHTIHANFFDMDNDGDLDAYILEYPHNFDIIMDVNRLSLIPDSVINGVDRILRNDNGHFVDVTAQSGITKYYGFGLSASTCDINNDGLQDIFVANDYLTMDRLLINKGNCKFVDESDKYFNKTSFFSMGSDFGDINNDQLEDLLVVDMTPIDNYRQKMNVANLPVEYYNVIDHYGLRRQYFRNVLQVRGKFGFQEMAEFSGVAKTDWSWGALFADLDNDGYQDIYIAKGTKRDLQNMDYDRLLFPDDPNTPQVKHRHDKASIIQGMPAFRGPNYAFHNNGNLTFTAQMNAWGLNQNAVSSGCAYADLDNDGDLDLIVNNTDAPAFLYKNNEQEQQHNNWLRIKLKGDSANTFGLGSKCYLFAGEQKMTRQMTVVHGYQSCSEPVMHFGLGKAKTVDSLIVEWPGGKRETKYNVAANQVLTLKQTDARKGPLYEPIPTAKNTFEQSNILSEPYVHHENSFNDFKRDRLLHRMFSKEGPGIAVGDLNGDGLDDIFVGNANETSSAIYIQDKTGKFNRQKTGAPQTDTLEILGALIIDVNNDGLNDLIVNSGSNEFELNAPQLGPKLYLNDKAGHLTYRPDMLPAIHTSSATLLACDFDGDGFKDLFIGGRITPGRYPETPNSYLLKNIGGKKFEDVTQSIAPELSKVGMVTSGIFTDYNNDGKPDLILVGEWMPVTVFKNVNGKKFEKQTIPALAKSNGWWNSINAGDFDNDGDVDYVLGNWGTNCTIKPSIKEPVSLYAADFDKNGSIDPLLFYYIHGMCAPFATRDAMCEKMPSFFNKFNTYDAFAKAGVKQILNKEQLGMAQILNGYTFENSYLENKGNGNFELRALPKEAQVSPVYGTTVLDIDNDGNLDIILSGNSYSFYLDQGNMDAGRGLVLKGNGAGGFLPLQYSATGFYAEKDAKSLAVINVGNNEIALIQANNNDTLRTFIFNVPFVKGRLEKISANTTGGELLLGNGKKRKVEFYDGCGYLSQQSRCLIVPENAEWKPAK